MTAPAAATVVASVTSADVSIPDNFVLSAEVIIAPDPALVISLNDVTLDVVYIPFVTVAAFPEYPTEVIVPNEDPLSENVIVPPSVSNVIPPDEFKVTVVPANSAAPSAVIVILAASAAASFVDIANAPFSDTVNVALSPADPVIVITLPFTSISSTVNDVSIPTDVIFV